MTHNSDVVPREETGTPCKLSFSAGTVSLPEMENKHCVNFLENSKLSERNQKGCDKQPRLPIVLEPLHVLTFSAKNNK